MPPEDSLLSSRRTVLGCLAAATAAPFLPWPLKTQASAAIPLRDFLRAPAISAVQIAPDGRSVCGIREVDGRGNLIVVDLETRKATIITNFRDGDVIRPLWISSKRILFSIYDQERGSGDQVNLGLFAIDKDAGDFRVLAGRPRNGAAGRSPLPGSTSLASLLADTQSDEVIVRVLSTGGTRRFGSHLHRLNTRTGRAELITLGAPSNMVQWVLDGQGVARAGVARKLDENVVHVRDSADAPWREIARFSAVGGEGFAPSAIDRDGTVYLSARIESDFSAIHRLDPATLQAERKALFSLKGFDLGAEDLVIERTTQRVLGIHYEAEREGVYWLDPERRAIQEQVDQRLPGQVNLLSFAAGRVLVHSYSDQDPGRHLIYTPATGALEQIASARPWINPKQMARTDIIRYPARDGLSIPAMLTLPRGEKKNLPLIVMHYGGPYVRTLHWRFDPYVQFLASRGYAVLMPSNRGSLGLGFNHFQAGWKQWGLAMQDDLSDGVQHLIAQGVADPQRVAIVGASYGGYAAMQGLAKEPDLFRCAVNWIGVTDPSFMFSVTWTDFAQSEAADYDLATLIGDPKTDAEKFRKTSPVQNAHRITKPVLMAYGGQDRRVPIVNGERMRDALKPHNAQVEWVVYPDEGHGFSKLENNLDFWGRVERFLATHLQAQGQARR